MAGAGYKLFNTGDVLTAAQVNTYLQEQAVMRFANSTARTTALSGVLAEGMMSYLDDTNSVEVYNGSSWVSVGSTGDITGVTAGTGISGGGSSGDVTITNSMATAIDAKGDLIVGTGADTFSRLAVGGTNGHVLTVDSGEATGMKWAAAAGGGANWSLLNSGGTALTGAATVTVSGISNADKIMVLIAGASSANALSFIQLRINSDSGSNYYQYGRYDMYGSTYASTNYDHYIGSATTVWELARMANSAGASVGAGALLTGCNSSGVKMIQAVGASNPDGSNSQAAITTFGYYNSSSTISSITVRSSNGNLDAGTVYVYTSA